MDEVGFRLEMITPADNPRSAVITGYGTRVCLDTEFSGSPGFLRLETNSETNSRKIAPNGTLIEFLSKNRIPIYGVLDDALIVSKLSAEVSMTTGRAGMIYRDLIPGRLGGRVIASHIHIPNGGPVPDYVHYHRVKFQMIYCKSGWVRVVYEDQGESFVMHAGDCVLQPPEIRHRVLESSDNLEVIEISSPAEHETFAEHEITLPTSTLRPDRDFSGQRFVRHIAEQTQWSPWRYAGFEVRNTGIDAATSGYASALTVRANKSATLLESNHQHQLMFIFILSGSAALTTGEDHETKQLQAGSSITLPSLLDFKLEITADNTELLVVEVKN